MPRIELQHDLYTRRTSTHDCALLAAKISGNAREERDKVFIYLLNFFLLCMFYLVLL